MFDSKQEGLLARPIEKPGVHGMYVVKIEYNLFDIQDKAPNVPISPQLVLHYSDNPTTNVDNFTEEEMKKHHLMYKITFQEERLGAAFDKFVNLFEDISGLDKTSQIWLDATNKATQAAEGIEDYIPRMEARIKAFIPALESLTKNKQLFGAVLGKEEEYQGNVLLKLKPWGAEYRKGMLALKKEDVIFNPEKDITKLPVTSDPLKKKTTSDLPF